MHGQELHTRADQPVMVLMPAGFSVRNFVHSGLCAMVRQYAEIVGVVPAPSHDVRAVLGVEFRDLYAFDTIHAGPFLREVQSWLGAAHGIRYARKTYRVLRTWFRREWTWTERARTLRIDLMGWLCSHQPLYGVLAMVVNRLRSRELPLDAARRVISSANPAMVVSTYCVDSVELPYVLAAKEKGIPVIAHILSFDNLTSRGLLPLVHDYFLVWNEKMRSELLFMYPNIKPDRVFVTGTPQFDFHMKEDSCFSREEVAKRLGLNQEPKWILYAANSNGLTPTEPELVHQIYDVLTSSLTDLNWQMVVRLHPMDDPKRWETLARECKDLRFCFPTDERFRGRKDVTTFDDQRLLVGVLKHSSVCICMGSTMSLDAAIVDTPVIGIAYAATPGSVEDKFYREAYGTEHYSPLARSGGIQLVYDHQELVKAVKTYLGDPEQHRDQRRRMVLSECGTVDGKAAGRIADMLLRFLQHSRGVRN